MAEAVSVSDAPRRLSRRSAWLPAAGASPRGLLRRLLLGSDGTVVCGWGDERSLDRAPGAACPSGESYSVRPEGRTRRRRCLYRRGCLDVVVFTAVTSRLLFYVMYDHDMAIPSISPRRLACAAERPEVALFGSTASRSELPLS